jgi:hypothetical protein
MPVGMGTETAKTLWGRIPKGAAVVVIRLNLGPTVGSSGVCEALKMRRVACDNPTSRGRRRSRELTALRGCESLVGKAQERIRDGISPAGRSGSKASRG